MITHDSVANFAPYQAAFTGFRTGVLPLWSTQMNAGEPLWSVVELHPAYDPVVLVVFAVATHLGATGITAFSFVLLVWLLGFAGGGWLLARTIGLSPVSRVFVFIVLLWSSVGILMLYQCQYVVIARWVPLALAVGWWLLRRPTISRGALVGVVVGLALPGYQTPYLALFAVVLACAGGRDALALVRGIPRRVLGVSIGITLAIMLPTIVAGIEWLGMAPVARLAWPYGTRGVLMSDVLVPLMGQRLSTESAFYVGVLPSLLAVIAGFAGLAALDRRARFWAWTTVGMMLIFLGAPEMIVGRDQPFLFVRDWTFVLPLVVLSVTMLAGIGLDYLTSRFPLPRVQSIATILTLLAFLDLSLFAHRHYRQIAVRRTPEFQAREPAPVRPPAEFSLLRRHDFDISAHAPFHKQGPTVWGIPSAYLDPEPFAPPYHPLVALGQRYTHGSHYFRLPRYDVVVATVPRSSFDCVAGVTCPIVRVVDIGVPAPDFTKVLLTLIQTPHERLHDSIVVEDHPGQVVPAPTDARAPGGRDAVGTFSVRSYRESSVEFDVVMRRPGFLYYADGYTPDWTARVDGTSAQVVTANGAFKAVFLTEGSHRVTMEYRPWRYVVAVSVRVIAILVGLGLGLRSGRRGASRAPEAVESSARPC